jgi:hypothetical protein
VGGTSHPDLYQPVHENNNILSYPAPTLLPSGEKGIDPPDMGSFRVPCYPPTEDCDEDPITKEELTTRTVTGPLLENHISWTWSGISGDLELKDTRTTTMGQERSHSHTVTPSLDFKTTHRFKVKKIDLAVSFDIEMHGNISWGETTITESTTSKLTSIYLHVPTGNSSEAYEFYPIFYNTTAGTMKVAFAVDMAGTSGEDFWNDHYGQQPDPALNLPHRFVASDTAATGTVWTPNTGTNRKLMRGFFVRHAEPQPGTDDVFTEYSGPSSVGETVRLEARVYNYSTLKGVGSSYGTEPLKVRFEYVELDGAREVGARTLIGDTTVESMPPRGMETATVNWTIPQFGDSSLSKNYRIYVVLDPDNAIPDEKYETESEATRTYCATNCADPKNWIDPGQNNEGYRNITVTSFPPAQPRDVPPADVHLKSDALAVIDRKGQLNSKNAQIYVGHPAQIRVRIDTDELGFDSQHVLLYDGDPNKGGTVIAGALAYTGNPAGNEVWFEWTPTKHGPYRLYAQVIESESDTNPGNAFSDELKVEVIKEPQGPKKPPGQPQR